MANKIISGVAYVAGFGSGIAASLCFGKVFEAYVPVANTEVEKVVRKVGKWGGEIVVHNIVSNSVKEYATDVLTAGEQSANKLKSMVEEEKKA